MSDAAALIMAGGQGTRMTASGVPTPKPLVQVAGRPLLRHNLEQLVRHGFQRVYVSVPAAGCEVGDYVTKTLVPVARGWGVVLTLLPEPIPLGNIGCAGLLRGLAEPLLVVYADNLTTLDLAAIVRHHESRRAALTLACHEQPFRIPYGRLSVHHGDVTGYLEKPTLSVTVCSAVTVLGDAALAALSPDRPTGLVDLTRRLLDAAMPVAAFPHHAGWVDVNDAAGIRAAEDLVQRNFEQFASLAPISPAAAGGVT